MKYVALLSGGKDSCYNLLHCHKNGHELIAAASLRPEDGKEELDSYLYQTVGQDAIHFISKALDVPLYRQVISGKSIEQGSEYGARNATSRNGIPGDETEDLFDLLSTVKTYHPDVKGVSVGAILSNYQRVRVEHVCNRLGLTALCYLWQRDQDELLQEMIDAQMNAVVIKVAGIGLTKAHLGKSLAELQPTLRKLNSLYGSHICGEGGEYESFTLDCPLFKKRIRLTEVETFIHSDNDFATVAYLRIKNAVLEEKESQCANPAQPALLDKPYEGLVGDSTPYTLRPSDFNLPFALGGQPDNKMRSVQNGPWVSVSHVQYAPRENTSDMTFEHEVMECFILLQGELKRYSLDLSHCTTINLYLSSMDLFTRVNPIYGSFFGTSPPSRATIAVDLPDHIHIRLDCIAFSETESLKRQALHVQSMSYWAPANIGPYSQVVVVGERMFISGQIGLIPASLSMPLPQSLSLETALSFQHVARVVNALENTNGSNPSTTTHKWEERIQSKIYWLVNEHDIDHVRRTAELHEKPVGKASPPSLFLVVKGLPRGALVERQDLIHTGRFSGVDEDGDPYTQMYNPTTNSCLVSTDGSDSTSVYWETSSFEQSAASVAIICFKVSHPVSEITQNLPPEFTNAIKHAVSVRMFHTPFLSSASVGVLDQALRGAFAGVPSPPPPATYIPCRSISTRGHDGWDMAIHVISA